MTNLKVMYMSNSNEWATPQSLFNKLDQEFHFNLDPCSTHQNAKCEKHFTIDEDGLTQDWGGFNVFVNPPYGKEIAKWVKKSWEEGRKKNTTVVMLIPARTDTSYFQDYIYNRSEIRFISGRVKFGEGKGSAPFPSMIVIFRGEGVRA